MTSTNENTRRILLVKDEKAIRDAVAAYLERENYWVTAVGDGQEALEEFSKHFPRQLSGGMRQRAALIRTLAFKPKILLLDEPFSALDFQTRLNVHNDISSIIMRENKTALLVTHDISEALKLGTKVLVMNNGKIEQFAKPEDLLRSPATEFVKELVKKERRTCYLPEEQLSSCEFSGASGETSNFDAK